MTSLFRILKNGFADFWRNKWVSQASIGVMTLTLIVIVSFFMIGGMTAHLIDNLKSRMDISLYFKIDTNENDILKVKSSLEKLKEVKQVSYVSRSDALAAFKKRHKDNPLILQSLEELGSNPLPASLNIQAQDPAIDFPFISQFLNKNYQALIDKINYQENKDIIARISAFSSGIKKAGLALSLMLTIIVILVTFNTIRLTIYSVRNEIGIMRLVGASNAYIRGPFIVEGIICGILATALSTFICWLVVQPLSNRISPMLLEFNLYQYFNENIWLIVLIQLTIATILGAFGSYIAVRKYLKI